MLDCLNKSIGLTRVECSCTEDGRPEDYNVSETELYITELDGMPLDLVQSLVECGDVNGLWSKLEQAKNNAIITTVNDLTACVSKNYNLILDTYRGYLAEPGYKRILERTYSPFIGVEVKSLNKKGTYLTIASIGLSINESGAFTVNIYSNNNDNVLGSYVINTVANRTTVLPLNEPLKLPLWDAECNALEYYIVYNPGTSKPMDNKLACGTCGSKLYIKNYVNVKGVRSDTVIGLVNGSNDGTYSNGVSISAVLTCDTTEVICNNYDDNYSFKQYVGQAVLYKAAENLLNYILSSSEISRFTMMKGEHITVKRNHYKTQYVDHITYLCNEIDIKKTDCQCTKQRIGLRPLYR